MKDKKLSHMTMEFKFAWVTFNRKRRRSGSNWTNFICLQLTARFNTRHFPPAG